MDLVKNAMERIGGENKSKHEVEYFIECIKILWLDESEGDWEDYVMNSFLADNGRDTTRVMYADIFKEFLGEDMKEKVKFAEGPHGGAFKSYDDLHNWREK